MKSNYSSVQALVDELAKQDKLKEDYRPMTSDITMQADGEAIGITGIKGPLQLTPLAHNQIADRLAIPRRFYEAIGPVPELRSTVVNSLFRHKDERRMVRTIDRQARAFLSDRFKAIDHMFVMEPFMGALVEHKKKNNGTYKIHTTSLSPSRMYIQLIFPNIKGVVTSPGRGKEDVNLGITLTNSEVGLGSFDVRTYLWWQWCDNGAITESVIRKYHTGRKVGDDDEDYNIYSEETIRKEMDAFKSRLNDIFRHALTDQTFQETLRKIQKLTDDKVEKPQTMIENVTKRFLLTDDQGERILNNMASEGNMNRYGLLNGITRLAQEVDDLDQAYDLEKLGNDIINLRPGEWAVLSEKAA